MLIKVNNSFRTGMFFVTIIFLSASLLTGCSVISVTADNSINDYSLAGQVEEITDSTLKINILNIPRYLLKGKISMSSMIEYKLVKNKIKNGEGYSVEYTGEVQTFHYDNPKLLEKTLLDNKEWDINDIKQGSIVVLWLDEQNIVKIGLVSTYQ